MTKETFRAAADTEGVAGPPGWRVHKLKGTGPGSGIPLDDPHRCRVAKRRPRAYHGARRNAAPVGSAQIRRYINRAADFHNSCRGYDVNIS